MAAKRRGWREACISEGSSRARVRLSSTFQGLKDLSHESWLVSVQFEAFILQKIVRGVGYSLLHF